MWLRVKRRLGQSFGQSKQNAGVSFAYSKVLVRHEDEFKIERGLWFLACGSYLVWDVIRIARSRSPHSIRRATLCYTGSIVNGELDVHVNMTNLAKSDGTLLFELRDPKSKLPSTT